MSQISPPIRILLVCAVAFLAAWMLFLRPSSDAGTPAAEAPAPTASTPPVEAGGEQAESLAGKAVEAANEATAKQDARAEQLAGGTGETATEPDAGGAAATQAPVTAATTKTGAPADVAVPTKEALATVPADVRRAIGKHQILVLGVVSPKGADEKSVRKALRQVDTLHGRVFVKTVPVDKISRYGTITRGLDVSQTPTVVVVDFRMQATALAGWADVKSIDQSVVDAIRYSGTLYTDPYLKQVARACTQWTPDVHFVFEPTTVPEARRLIGNAGASITDLKHAIAGISTPKKWRPFSHATQADLATMATSLTAWQAAMTAEFTFARFQTTLKQHGPTLRSAGNRLDERFQRHDVLACGNKG